MGQSPRSGTLMTENGRWQSQPPPVPLTPDFYRAEKRLQRRERVLQDAQPLLEQFLADDERRQEAQHVAERPAGKHDKPMRVTERGDRGGGRRVRVERA